jgi:hypothetical protein
MLIGLGFSINAMAGRVNKFNADADRKLWTFSDPIDTRAFRYAGREVAIKDTTGPDGKELVVTTYGERELKLTPSITPKDPKLPGLFRHADWFKVFRFAEYPKKGSVRDFRDSLEEGKDRLVFVTRRPLTTADPRTGEVWARDWTFDFHEFLPDGTIHTEGFRLPKTKGDIKTPKPNELSPGTWQMEAALRLMPPTPADSLNLGRPTAAFKKDAVSVMGWTLPVATLTALGLMISLALGAAPRRRHSSARIS